MEQDKMSHVTALSVKFFGRFASHLVFFKQAYVQSGLYKSYESYTAIMLFSCLITFVSAFASSVLIHSIVLDMSWVPALFAALVLSGIFAIAVLTIFIAYPSYRRSQRRKDIDTHLVYTAGYMGVLSAGGISLERIFERVAEVERRAPLRDLESRLIADVKIFGLDVGSALQDVILHSPSEVFSKFLAGINNALKTSANLKSLLKFESKELLQAKREQLKGTLDSLTAFGEIYITGVVIAPIVFIIMVTVLSIMGNVTFGISPVVQLNLLVFFGIPMLGGICVLFLNSILPEED